MYVGVLFPTIKTASECLSVCGFEQSFCSPLERGEMLREKKQANRTEVMSRSTSRSFPTLACLNILKGKREEDKDEK